MAWRKAVSLWVTDSRTPVIGLLAEKVLRIVHSGRMVSDSWRADVLCLDGGEKVNCDEFMASHLVPVYPFPPSNEAEAAVIVALEEIGISKARLDEWCKELAEHCFSITDIPKLLTIVPDCTTAGINGMTVTVDNQQFGDLPEAPEPQQPQPTYCKHYLKKKCTAKKCKFLHGKFCRDFLNAECKRRPCKYPHVNCEGVVFV
jgi:hypothetical protein